MFSFFLGWSNCWANSRVDLIMTPCNDAIVHHRTSARQCLGLGLHFIFTGIALMSVEQLECEIMLLCYHECYHQSWSLISFWVGWAMIWTVINKSYTTIIIRDCSALHGNYRQLSNISRTLVDTKLVDHSDVVGLRLSALLQLHLQSRLNTWFEWIGQRQLQDETSII